ncbi:MAG: NAD-dependent epimerase/dehydratase family protein [Chloroflexi bacterium]|nr:NAD-dependent epimerase/dehydratase family protein [Chloroflexota bacterium]
MMEELRGKKVLITGGLGFIGSNLARALVELGAEVLLVDSLIPDYGGNLLNIQDIRERVRINIADIRDKHSMDWLVQGQDYIFNLAGQVSHLDSMQDPYTDLEINCRSQLSLLEACRHHNPEVKIVYASTRQIYGIPDYLPVDEKHLLHPTDVNGINKMAGEWYHILYHNVYGLRTASLRLTNTYGPRQLMKHNRQGFIGWFIRLAIDGQEIQIYGDGKQKRDLNYVDDVVQAFLLAAVREEANGQVFNLGGPEPVNLIEIALLLKEICPACSYKLVPFPNDIKRIDIGDYYADYKKIKNTLGWEPTIAPRQGLERTVDYYQQYKEYYWS